MCRASTKCKLFASTIYDLIKKDNQVEFLAAGILIGFVVYLVTRVNVTETVRPVEDSITLDTPNFFTKHNNKKPLRTTSQVMYINCGNSKKINTGTRYTVATDGTVQFVR